MLKIKVKMPRGEYRHLTGHRTPNQRRLKKLATRMGIVGAVQSHAKRVMLPRLPYLTIKTKVVVCLPSLTHREIADGKITL